MRCGDFAAAWRISDAVLRRRIDDATVCDDWPRHLQFIWKGQDLTGQRVLVRCYHGLGDTLQFVRLLAPLRERTREIILWVQPALIPLLRSVHGIDRLLPLHDGAPAAAYDSDIELMELPHILRISCNRIPGTVPYICVAPRRPRLTRGHLHVGVVWRSGDWVTARSISDAALATLACVSGVRWYSLQYPPARMPFAMIDLACADIAQMAARMQALDLVICVDTMAAHLAGALAIPVWTLLHDQCDWRWMTERSDTPWYPTMRLFRQRRGGGWGEVIDAVAAGLVDWRRSHDSSARYSFSLL